MERIRAHHRLRARWREPDHAAGHELVPGLSRGEVPGSSHHTRICRFATRMYYSHCLAAWPWSSYSLYWSVTRHWQVDEKLVDRSPKILGSSPS